MERKCCFCCAPCFDSVCHILNQEVREMPVSGLHGGAEMKVVRLEVQNRDVG